MARILKLTVGGVTYDVGVDTSAFITKAVSDLTNYYDKDTVDGMVSAIPKFAIQVVAALPTSNISTTTIYLVTSGEESQNLYDEYIYVNNSWEKLGTQTVDLSGYVRSTDLATVATSGSYTDLSNVPSEFTPAAHNQASNTINAMTGYAKNAGSDAAIAAADTLNVAMAKLETKVDLKAPIASPDFSGTPTAPTATAGTNTTQIATTAFVKTAVDTAVGSVDTGVMAVTTGTDNGTIKVDGTDVAVKGLDTAAYQPSSAFASASHTHVGTEVTLTGYAKAGNTGAVAASDNVNVAIAKLENAVEAKGDPLTAMTAAEATAGSVTEQRSISPKVLADRITESMVTFSYDSATETLTIANS